MTARVNSDSLINSLRDLYGETITSADVRGYCASNGVSYPTVTKYLDSYKSGRGKWNLTVQEARQQLETAASAPAFIPPVEQNLIPQKDDTFVKFGNFTDIKKLLSPIYSIRRSLLVFLVTARRSLSNKRVLNSDGNSSV